MSIKMIESQNDTQSIKMIENISQNDDRNKITNSINNNHNNFVITSDDKVENQPNEKETIEGFVF